MTSAAGWRARAASATSLVAILLVYLYHATTHSSSVYTALPLRKFSASSFSTVTPWYTADRFAIGIKTFMRAQCATTLVDHYQQHYPGIRIYVADDSFANSSVPFPAERYSDVIHLRLPDDSGVAYGRNRLAEAAYADQYEYLFITDDDYLPAVPNDLLTLYQHYHATGADIIAGSRSDGGVRQRSFGSIMNVTSDPSDRVSAGHNIYMIPSLRSSSSLASSCQRTDIIQHVLISRPATLLHMWDDRLKNNDHYDFLFNAKQQQLRVYGCHDVVFDHITAQCQAPSAETDLYKGIRKSRWLQLAELVFDKWRLEAIHDEVGKRIQLNQIVGQRAVALHPARTIVHQGDAVDNIAMQALSQHNIDTKRDWTYDHSASKKWSEIVINPCQSRCKGEAWVLPSSTTTSDAEDNSSQKLRIDVVLTNETCFDRWGIDRQIHPRTPIS